MSGFPSGAEVQQPLACDGTGGQEPVADAVSEAKLATRGGGTIGHDEVVWAGRTARVETAADEDEAYASSPWILSFQ